jgi:DNA-directed RNA polymerase specialized sigma24 family protein
MLSHDEFRVLYRSQAEFVRRRVARYKKHLQPADLENVEQNVWLNVLTRWPDESPPNVEAYLTDVVKNAVADVYRRAHRKKRDERRNARLVVDETSGPVDVGMIDPVDVAVDFERARTKKRVRAVALQLTPRDAATFDKMMEDFESVPKKDRDRVVAAVRAIMALPRTASVENTDDVDGPSHCGRTMRRLGLDTDDGDVIDDEWADAAE